jgi:hypothetical protein
MEAMVPAEQALQLLFKKLHPHLEDAAHALARLEDPAFQARNRWAGVDPEIGDEARE